MDAATDADAKLTWVALDLVRNRHLLHDGHLVVSALRLAHALGVHGQNSRGR